jgi:hypothetical protein
MASQLNGVLPADQNYSHYWWTPNKSIRLSRDYRKYFPEDDLARRKRIASLVMILSFAFMILLSGVMR